MAGYLRYNGSVMSVVDSYSHAESKSERLRRLLRLYESGPVTDVTERTLAKLLATETAAAEAGLAQLTADLALFETTYGLASDAFYRRFSRGELGDAMDYIEWASLYEMAQRARDRLELLREIA